MEEPGPGAPCGKDVLPGAVGIALGSVVACPVLAVGSIVGACGGGGRAAVKSGGAAWAGKRTLMHERVGRRMGSGFLCVCVSCVCMCLCVCVSVADGESRRVEARLFDGWKTRPCAALSVHTEAQASIKRRVRPYRSVYDRDGRPALMA